MKKTKNFGFGKMSKEQETAVNMVRMRICEEMANYQNLIGFKDFNDQVKVLSVTAVNVCLDMLGQDYAKNNPKAFESFVKLALSDIIKKMKKSA